MSEVYLITRPEHDDTTYYPSSWSRGTIEKAENHGIRTIDLHRQKAVKKEVESRIKKFAPRLIVLNGHGDENRVTGHKNQPVIIAGENDKVLQSAIVYAISCKSAKNLGPKSVENGTTSYSGYDDDFIFFYEPQNASRPLNDKTAELFLKPSLIFIESLLKRNTVDEARQRAIKEMKRNLYYTLGNTSETHLAKFIWWNMKHFVSHGDSQATL